MGYGEKQIDGKEIFYSVKVVDGYDETKAHLCKRYR